MTAEAKVLRLNGRQDRSEDIVLYITLSAYPSTFRKLAEILRFSHLFF